MFLNLYGQEPLLELGKKHFHDWLSKLYLDWSAKQPLTGVGGPFYGKALRLIENSCSDNWLLAPEQKSGGLKAACGVDTCDRKQLPG